MSSDGNAPVQYLRQLPRNTVKLWSRVNVTSAESMDARRTDVAFWIEKRGKLAFGVATRIHNNHSNFHYAIISKRVEPSCLYIKHCD